MGHEWRDHQALKGRFHSSHPDDLEVILHDGGPRITRVAPELCWVHVTGMADDVFRGQLINQPHNLQTIREGDEVLFIVAEGCEQPIRVTKKYLRERPDWIITPCDKCGFSELFDAPSDLNRAVFPNMPEGSIMQVFTAFCPFCGGIQLIKSRNAPDESQRQPTAGTQPPRQAAIESSDSHYPSTSLGLIYEFLRNGKRLASVLSGVALAGSFLWMPFTKFGAEAGPWYFWIMSAVIALTASVLMAWVFFPPSRRK